MSAVFPPEARSFPAMKRLRNACIIFVLFVLLLCASGEVITLLFDGSRAETDHEMLSPETPQVSFGTILTGDTLVDMRDQLPDDFEEEIFCLDTYPVVLVSENKKVIGFFSYEDSAHVFDQGVQQLSSRGWTKVESGYSGIASFVKEEGKYRWILLSCSTVGEETSAVLQIG